MEPIRKLIKELIEDDKIEVIQVKNGKIIDATREEKLAALLNPSPNSTIQILQEVR